MRERWFSKRLFSALCLSIWVPAPRLADWLMLLMASTLLQVQLPGPTTGCHAPPSLLASESMDGSPCYTLPPRISPFVSCPLLRSWISLHSSHFLTSAEGNASCLAALILFSWWSALISLPQQVSGPESKRIDKGKWCRTILGSYDMLN